MRRGLGILLGLLCAVGWGFGPARGETAPADPIQVRVTADRSRATVGDPIVLRVEVRHPEGVTVSAPVPLLENDQAVVVEEAPPSASAPPAPDPPGVRTFRFRAQVFQTGERELPAFAVDWRGADGKSGRVTSGKAAVTIESVLKSGQDAPADLKPPAELPAPPFPWRRAAGIALLSLALAAALVTLWRRRRRPAGAVAAPVPSLPPHEQAYRELERLVASSLLREGKIKEFHVELIEIVKRYLEGRFGIEALDRTTEELLHDLKRVRVGTQPREVAREVLNAADLVKFARHAPAGETIRASVDRAYRLVDLTRVVPAPSPAAAAGPASVSGSTTPEGAA